MTEQLIICGGCNAKLGPEHLSTILEQLPKKYDKNLLVGYESSDDASVYKLSDDIAIIQTLDFFPTMVADPYLFGQIAATNALSDVYAMGGNPVTALNIVAFPESGSLDVLSDILRGGAEKIHEAGAVLSGGHSIHDSQPKYGLSVTGVVHPNNIIQNNTCKQDDCIILTKPLGVGIVTTAYSIGEISKEAFDEAVTSMTTLNKYAAEVMKDFEITSCTDVTGFGLLGHLYEMVGEDYSAMIDHRNVPYIKAAYEAAQEFLITAGGQRNRNYLQNHVKFEVEDFGLAEILFDPQTSGGLLMTINQEDAPKLLAALHEHNVPASIIGQVCERQQDAIIVK